MESNISLIEVAGEDDSLLQQIPEDGLLDLEREMDGATARNSGFFLCSPLLTNRSIGAISSSSTASAADHTDKENINANDIEGPNLSIMPQQMKRKKKAGGYNLRKSLAWNKAFFTEEGVLDSMELSMITGSTNTLGAIDEEIPAMPGGSSYNDLSFQDKLFKDTSTGTPIGDRKNGRCLLPKRGSSTKDNVKLKELSAKDLNRSGSKRGSCPRPVASSSVKRPTTSNATKTMNKEERTSRIPVPKRDSTVIPRAPRNAATIRASDAKSNQVAQRGNHCKIAQTVVSNPKMSTSKSSSMNSLRALNKDVNASKSLKAKNSIQQPGKLANPVLKVNSSRCQHESVDPNEGLKAGANSLISKPLPSNDDGTKKASASITQNAPPDGRSMLNPTQMPKPSGLRMPSPSMGFFGQKKVSSFQSVPPDTSELHDLSKSSIPNVRIRGPSNPICQLATLVPRNVVKANHGEASGETKVVSCLSSGSSIEPVSHYRAKSALKLANIHLGKVDVIGASTMNKALSAHGLVKPDVLSLSNPVLEHLGDVSRTHHEIKDQLAGDSTKSYLDETNECCSQGMQNALDDQLRGAKDCNEQSSEQVEVANSSYCKIERTSSDHQRVGIGTCNSLKRSRTSIEFDHGIFEDVSNDSNGWESCSFDQDEDLETRKMRILRTRKAEPSDVDHFISNECNNTMQTATELSNSDSMHIDDENPTGPILNNQSLQGNGYSLASQNEFLTKESNDICENKVDSDYDLSSIPHSTADACNNCTDEMVDIVSDMQQNHTSFETERYQNDRGDVEIACNADVAETLLISRDFHSSDTENQLYEAHIRIESEHVQNEDKQNSLVQSSVNDCCIDLVDVSPKNNQGKCSIDDLLHRSNSEEIISVDNYDVCTSEGLSNCNQMASPKDNNSIHEETHDTRTGDNILESRELEASLRSSRCSTAKSSEDDKSGEGTSETMSKITSESRMTCNDQSFCSPTKDLGSSIPNDDKLSSANVQQYAGTKELENHKSPEMNEMCSTYNDNAQSEATTCNDSSFRSPTKDLGSSVPNDDILSRENVQQCMETKELENHKSPEMNGNLLHQNENEFNSEMDHLLNTEMCSTSNENAQSKAKATCNDSSFCSPTKDLDSLVPHDDILYMEAKELENHRSPEMNENELNSEIDHLLDTETSGTNDNSQSMELRKSEGIGKQNVGRIKTSTNAVPFSEEWLAAIEAAGEEILTMKTGAVQNSPPDKSKPEPGPWSPVKRKNNQEIGPFDCTKCTNGSQLHESS
ncbi:uncharacterized protein LOC111448106 isoform X1 [Cucurbita moschata]|uniref:Uncharacterized protein LOC111448106 isoform X1 n=1 Tax=Cucurbita moschata TaxID=3662 RepID=A0A6J1FTV2_CUCMO|nr:uncharacterized protein LOC111448106 isoform X1 [Cucurbita moschata]